MKDQIKELPMERPYGGNKIKMLGDPRKKQTGMRKIKQLYVMVGLCTAKVQTSHFILSGWEYSRVF